MILKLYSTAALITVATLVSCAGNDNKDYVDKSIIPAGSEKTTTQPATTTATGNTAPVNTPVIPGASTVSYNPQQSMVNAVPQQTTAATTTATGMNPAHGQPGHRCDIAVGAPLNSKPAPAPTTTTTAQPVALTTPQQPAVTMTQVPTTTKTAPGMNPPHGEPNHRCDIAVGAPLNSKPAPTTAQPVAMNTQQQPAAVTATQVPAPTKTVTAPGMNPPHGEPNHRCDIAVGAPLNSKPVPTTVQTTAPPALVVPSKSDSTKN
ncbi:MAG: hypothetical protein ABIO79_08715 [Ferruginibacter sp.]